MKSIELSPKQVNQALSEAAILEKAAKLKPSVSDYVSEGVIDHVPDPGPDGKIDQPIKGNRNVIRALQMMEAHYLEKGRIGAARQAGIRRIPMRDRHGRIRLVAEEREDHSALKNGSRRLVTVSGRRLKDWPNGHEMLRDGIWQRYLDGEWGPL